MASPLTNCTKGPNPAAVSLFLRFSELTYHPCIPHARASALHVLALPRHTHAPPVHATSKHKQAPKPHKVPAFLTLPFSLTCARLGAEKDQHSHQELAASRAHIQEAIGVSFSSPTGFGSQQAILFSRGQYHAELRKLALCAFTPKAASQLDARRMAPPSGTFLKTPRRPPVPARSCRPCTTS